MKYKIYACITSYAEAYVEAEDEDDAIEKFYDMRKEDFVPCGDTEWEFEEVVPCS